MINFDLIVSFDNKVIERHKVEKLVDEVEKLVKVTFLLGGIGKRSRRGFGSIRITKIDGHVVFSSLAEVKSFITTIPQNQIPNLDYPSITNIEVSGHSYDNYEEILIKIGESSHSYKHDSLGYARPRERLASPIYTSVIKENNKFYPIITTLNNTFGNTSNQNNYKMAIL